MGFGSPLLLHIVFKQVEKFVNFRLSHWHGQINPELRREDPVVQKGEEKGPVVDGLLPKSLERTLNSLEFI
jgi:hypothetical protein